MYIFRLRRLRRLPRVRVQFLFGFEPDTAFRAEQDQVFAAVETINPVPPGGANEDQNTPDSHSSPSPLSPVQLEVSPSTSGSDMSSAVASSSAHSETAHLCEDEDEYSDPEFDLLCSQVPESVLRGEKMWKGKSKEE